MLSKDLQTYEDIKRLLFIQRTRVALCERNFQLFCYYYFPKLHGFPDAKFHKKWYGEFESDKHMLNIGFRESGKTVKLIMYLIWVICYKKYRNIIFYGATDKNITPKLFDVIIQLQTNKLLVNDFGELVSIKKSSTEKEKKTVSQFITSNGVRVKASSIKVSPRGDNFMDKDGISHRPDLFLGDDLDTLTSTTTGDMINDNYFFLKNEIFGGFASNAKYIILGNVIREDGIVPRLKKEFEKSDKWKVTRLPVEVDGEIVWDRIVRTNKEVKIKGQISLESKLEEQGEDAFNANMYLKPFASLMMSVFNLDMVDKLQAKNMISTEVIEVAVGNEKVVVGIDIYDPFKGGVVVGVDVGKGKGVDFTVVTIRKKNGTLVAELKANRIEQYKWAYILDTLYRKGYRFLRNGLGIENNAGEALISECRHFHWFDNAIHNMSNQARTFEKNSTNAGWNTNSRSKPIMIDYLSKLINSGKIELSDDCISQLKTYIFVQLGGRVVMEAKKGYHDDFIISNAISLQMIKYCFDY